MCMQGPDEIRGTQQQCSGSNVHILYQTHVEDTYSFETDVTLAAITEVYYNI